MLYYLEFLTFYVPGVSSMLYCWGFFHVMLAGASYMLRYLEFLTFYVT